MFAGMFLIPGLALMLWHSRLGAILTSGFWLPWIGGGVLLLWAALLAALVLWTEPHTYPDRAHSLHRHRGPCHYHARHARPPNGPQGIREPVDPADGPAGELRRASPADLWISSWWLNMDGAPLAMPGFPLPAPASLTPLEWVAQSTLTAARAARQASANQT